MTNSSNELFERHANSIKNYKGNTFLSGEMLEALTIARQGEVSTVYAPFDFVEAEAKLVIVGITPGRVQAENALAAARAALREGKTHNEALQKAKKVGSFSGPLRINLVALLDYIGLNTYFGCESCETLFAQNSTAVHFTSALRYPVLINGNNYNGMPKFNKTPLLQNMVSTQLRSEAEQLPKAVWLPLGPIPAAAIQTLVDVGTIDARLVLGNLPHPSGANAERIAYFLGKKDKVLLSPKTSASSLDTAKSQILKQVAMLKGGF